MPNKAFRIQKRLYKSKRKELEIIWNGERFVDVANVVRYAPSSCNSQPWRVFCESDDIQIYCSTQVRSMIPEGRRPYYNSIDMGIFLCFMEIALKNKGYEFKRMVYAGQKKDEELIVVADYRIV